MIASSCPRAAPNRVGCEVGALPMLFPAGGGDRALVLGPGGVIVADSWKRSTGEEVRLVRTGEGADFTLDGTHYLGISVRNRLVLAAPAGGAEVGAVSSLLWRLVAAGAVALVFAVAAALLVGGAMTRRLSELSRAAEDIGRGNYSRRVDVGGSDEIGVVGGAFNRMAEAVERSRQLQREFLANASHELKTPLTSLIGFSQALVDGSLPTRAEQARAAAIVHEEAERVLRLSQELLDLARVESGQVSYRLQPVDLSTLLREEAELLHQRAADRGLLFDLVLPPVLPPVHADPDRLHQIVANLLDNAVKYAPRGSTVRVEAAADGEGVDAAVSNPTGTHRPDPQRMFDRFYRGDPSRSSANAGVGLGLAICRQLAEGQRGRLWAELQEGVLSLKLSLPRAAAHG
ncbi:MAG: sensor histidine kinase [Candidatus Dormibacterales bacterium]